MNRTPLTDWRSGDAAPILVLQGKEDITVPENADRLVAEFPRSCDSYRDSGFWSRHASGAA